jgi:putative transposase
MATASSRNSSPGQLRSPLQTFFVNASCCESRDLLESSSMASMLLDLLLQYRLEKRFLLHEFVVMPNHLHLLITLPPGAPVERTVKEVKDGFSFRAGRELDYQAPIWHSGFADTRIRDERAYRVRQKYIHEEPVRACLVLEASDWKYSSAHPGLVLDPCPRFSQAMTHLPGIEATSRR